MTLTFIANKNLTFIEKIHSGDIVIDAGGTLQAGTVTTSLGGLVDLEAQLSGGNMPFVIGTSGTNGVGKVSTSGTDNGSDYTLQASTAVYVVNGNSSSTGGITITAVADLAVANGGGGRAGAIILNAQNGTLKVPGGFTLAGTTNLVGGGFLTFLANTVQFTTTATLNVSQNTATNVRPYNTQINISAANITYTTLTLNANGIGVPAGYDGLTETYPAGVFLSSQNQLEVADTQTVVDNLLTVHTIFVNPTGNPLSSLTLTGTGALTVTANGNTEQASVRGYPISISGGTTVSLSSTGSTNHGIYISNEATPAGQPGITFGNTTTVTLNANGLLTASAATTSGGYVYITGDLVAFNAKTFTISANGPTTGNGNGGVFYLTTSLLSTGSAFTSATISANAASAGTGNAQQSDSNFPFLPGGPFEAINIQQTPQLNLVGTTQGAFNFSATGGKTGGNGGTIEVGHVATNLTLGTVSASAGTSTTSTGNAGIVNFHDISQLTVSKSVTAAAVGTGQGGSITLDQTGFNKMVLDSATISASGGCTGTTCGIINITSVAAISAVEATMHADGVKGANGGQLNIVSSSDTATVTIDNALITASGSTTTPGGNGGFVNVSNNFLISVGTGTEGAKLHADGSLVGSGGQVRITTGTSQPLVASASTFSVTAIGGPTGPGGIIVIPSLSQLSTSAGAIYAVNTFLQASSGTGVTDPATFGGSISLNNVICQNTLTGYSWPTSYWNCSNPGSPTSIDAQPALDASQYVPAASQTQLVKFKTGLYVFGDQTHANLFFNLAQVQQDAAGATLAELSGTTIKFIDVTVFESYTGTALTSAQLGETSTHELGHALDASGGYKTETSGSAAYTTAIKDDQNHLNGLGAPCQANSAGPFNGVIDFQTGQQFCSSGGTGSTLNNPNYAGLTNSQIAAASQPGIFGSNLETFAQGFAFQSYVITNGPTNYPLSETADGLFLKNLYSCAQAVGAGLAGKTYTSPYSCK